MTGVDQEDGKRKNTSSSDLNRSRTGTSTILPTDSVTNFGACSSSKKSVTKININMALEKLKADSNFKLVGADALRKAREIVQDGTLQTAVSKYVHDEELFEEDALVLAIGDIVERI